MIRMVFWVYCSIVKVYRGNKEILSAAIPPSRLDSVEIGLCRESTGFRFQALIT